MQTPTEEVGACVEIDPTAQLFGETVAARIVPNERTQHKQPNIDRSRQTSGPVHISLLVQSVVVGVEARAERHSAEAA